MKQLLLLPFLLLSMMLMTAKAQSGMEDVVYLNNGSVLRGIIVEQVPNKSLKVQIAGGSIFKVEIADVERITKESPLSVFPGSGAPDRSAREPRMRDSTRVREPWSAARRKGYFLQGQVLLELAQGGLRVVNGYKFGRFGYLGVGLGLDLSGPSISHAYDYYWGSDDTRGMGAYLPVYLHYSGDVLNRRVTPFYAVELGYALALGGPSSHEHARGGAMGGGGIGVKFNTRRRLNMSLLFNLNFKNVSYREYWYWYDDLNQMYHTESQRVRTVLFYPGLRLGIGF
jgi:hypothetical protein